MIDPRFSRAIADNDPRFPGMVIATLRTPSDSVAFPVGSVHMHDGAAMRVVGVDAGGGVVRLRPAPQEAPKPIGPIHLYPGHCNHEEIDRTSTEVESVTCVDCLAGVEALAVRCAARRKALEATA